MKAYTDASTLSAAERDELVTKHISLAQRMANKMAYRTPHDVDDLAQVAMIGLLEASRRYDPTRPEPFEAFARRRIRGAMLDELRRRDTLPRRARAWVKRAGEVAREVELRRGRAAEDSEVAAAMGIDLQSYLKALQDASAAEFVPFDEPAMAQANDAASPLDEAEYGQAKAMLRQALGRIPERDARVLALYYVEDFTYAEIAEVLGVSAPRVCQLHGRAMNRLRAEFQNIQNKVQEAAA